MPLTQWLGLAILVGFSLALSLFMRLERKSRPEPPDELRDWTRVESLAPECDTYVERRVVQLPSRGFRPARWVEQRRVRRTSDACVVEVMPERPFRWRGKEA